MELLKFLGFIFLAAVIVSGCIEILGDKDVYPKGAVAFFMKGPTRVYVSQCRLVHEGKSKRVELRLMSGKWVDGSNTDLVVTPHRFSIFNRYTIK